MVAKKILIISQAIFPAQFPRAYRATELAIEFARQGHDVTLYAVLGKYDYSGFEKEYNLKIKNIGKMWFATLNSDNTGRRNFFDRVLRRLFHRFLEFPDIELMFRMPGIISKENNIDLLVTVAMPYPLHWGSAFAKSLSPKKFPKIWAADCGDPHMGNKVIKRKPLFYFKYLEKWFGKKADFIIVPTQNIISAYYPEFKAKIKVIPQGFNFNIGNPEIAYSKNDIPTFAFAGIFYKETRNPSSFLEFLCKVKLPFKFIIYNPGQSLLKPYYSLLKDRIIIKPYIQRVDLINELKTMDFLININNVGNYGSPSKLIDYAIAGRPILSFTSDAVPETTFMEFLQGNFKHQFVVENISQYKIENVAKDFFNLINN
jgi:glycosyltransferase involved in cell wall biosynthesis